MLVATSVFQLEQVGHKIFELLWGAALVGKPVSQVLPEQLLTIAFCLHEGHDLHQPTVHDESWQALGIIDVILFVPADSFIGFVPGMLGALLFQSYCIIHGCSPSCTRAMTRPRPVVASPPICSRRPFSRLRSCAMTSSASSSPLAPCSLPLPVRVLLVISGAMSTVSGGRFSV